MLEKTEKIAANTDGLTGLVLGKQLSNDLNICLTHASDGYMLIFDVENFADINLQHGSSYGDKILQSVAKELNSLIKDWNYVYRLANDRFAALILRRKHEDIVNFCEKLNKNLENVCSLKIGITHFLASENVEAIAIIQRAEVALKSAKNSYQKNVVFFSETGYKEYLCKLKLQQELHNSIRNNFDGFYLCYQPLISGKDYSLLGAEALLRYISPTKGAMSPAQFIPLLEETEMICAVGFWVLRESIKQCMQWRKIYPGFRISVNVSYVQMRQPKFPEDVLKALKEFGAPGEALTLEITESMHLHDFEKCNKIFTVWKNAGIHIAMDDFGTGYSSLSYLKKLHFNSLKVDQYFIAGLTETPYNYKLISNVLDLANFSDITVCLEGVETEEQVKIIHDLRADCLQGYIFSKPVVAKDFEAKFIDETSPEHLAYQKQIEKFAGLKRKERNYSSHLFWTMMNDESGYDVVTNNRDNILRRMRIGLWITRFTKDKSVCEMYIDSNCAEVFGLDKPLSPEETYKFWKSRICEQCKGYVNYETEQVVYKDKTVQLEYYWNHPKLGVVRVRCVSVRASDSNGMITIKGYHRIVSEIVTTTFEEWQKQHHKH